MLFHWSLLLLYRIFSSQKIFECFWDGMSSPSEKCTAHGDGLVLVSVKSSLYWALLICACNRVHVELVRAFEMPVTEGGSPIYRFSLEVALLWWVMFCCFHSIYRLERARRERQTFLRTVLTHLEMSRLIWLAWATFKPHFRWPVVLLLCCWFKCCTDAWFIPFHLYSITWSSAGLL